MNLRERARLAYLDRKQAVEDELLNEAISALCNIIGDEPVEVAKLDPPTAYLKVDGLDFRVAVETVEHSMGDKEKSSVVRWSDTEAKVWVRRAPSDYPVTSLADIGAVFSRDSLLDESSAAATEPVPLVRTNLTNLPTTGAGTPHRLRD